VGAKEGGKTLGLDGLVAEELDQVVGAVKGRGEETIGGRDVAVAAADEGANAGAARERAGLA